MKLLKIPFYLIGFLLLTFGCTPKDEENIENEIPELLPVYEVYHNDVKIVEVTLEDILNPSEQEDWQTVKLVYGDSLIFKDVTTVGEPTGRTWLFNGSETTTSTTKETHVIYTIEGDHLAGEVTFIREGSDYPDASITSEIPLKINVSIPALLPAFKVMNNDTEVVAVAEGDDIETDESKWTKVTVYVGESLTFSDVTTTGFATDRTWTLGGVEIDDTNAKEVTATYTTVGTYSAGKLQVNRKGTVYPDAEVETIIPLKVEVITRPLVSGIHVFRGDDLDNAIYQIASGNEGEAKTIALENGEKLTFKLVNDDTSVKHIWSINNGTEQTAETVEFGVTFSEDNDGLVGHAITLKREGQEDVVIQIPLTVKVVTSPSLNVGVRVYKNDDMQTALYEVVAGDEPVAASITLEAGDKLSFVDASTGEPTSRTWTIDNNEEITSSEATFDVTYSTVGTFESSILKIIRNGHSDYSDQEKTVTLPLSIKVIDTPELKLGMAVYKSNDMETALYTVNLGETPSAGTIDLNNGEELIFVDKSTGSTTGILWTIDNGEGTPLTSAESSFGVTYATDGNFSVTKLKLTRNGHADYVDVEEEFEIPLTVNVSTVITEVSKNSDISLRKVDNNKVISFTVEEALVAITEQETAKAGFTVTVQNDEAGFGPTTFTVASVAINTDNTKQIDITVAEELYNSDVVTVAFTGADGNAIVTAEGARLANFASEQIASYYNRGNILNAEMASFSIEKESNAPYAAGWYNQNKVITWNRETSGAMINTLKFYAASSADLHGTRDRVQSVDADQSIEGALSAGDLVRVAMDIYIPAGNGMTDGLSIQFLNPSMNSTPIPTADLERGKWVTTYVDIIMTSDLIPPSGKTAGFSVQLTKDSVVGIGDGEPIEFYIDNLVIEKYEVRQ
ncbi:hypothetical protein [Flammeovirga kamogawensis]|uniref:PKD domain-containing protein n=1 Tax=Flammeovirga kamogawensis TaxID=373891 RepID=A0ABX8H3W9_9BACT|nr:hypothetical protein [Flammeovirga kamogawensis]MBB6463526.1 plastocyanin [Flammeovirga kamogawensis]QWG10584.1 hypothetical protein KM029_24685 [Flammeovirga kamogawensis]TRX63690.1 hypothetical protein EO216_25070 [Flammeovirga kamogawensis]